MDNEKKLIKNDDAVIKKTDIPTDPHYTSATKDGWGIEMNGLEAADGSNADHAGILGMPMTNFTVEAKDIKKVRVRNKRGKWLPFKTGFDKVNGFGDGTNITGIEIVGEGFIYAIHAKGGQWMQATKTSDIEGEVLGICASSIDAIWIDKI